MSVNELLDEYNLAADDVRWSLCKIMAQSLYHTLEDGGVDALTRRLWSGEIGDELYNIGERWANDRDDRLARAVLDEGHLRDELSQMTVDKISRRQR